MASAEAESLAAPLLEPSARRGDRDPFVEVRLYRRGAGPVAIFRSDLSGPRRDRLDVRRIQANHGLRALYAFKPEGSRRGLRIRCDPTTGYSALPFRDGAAIALDGEPKESWTKPASVIVAGLLVPAVMAVVVVNGVPEPLRSWRVINGMLPPWILVSAVIIFARARTRPRAP
ncbi:hypothetical protein HU200_055804 [Digitaria exilis]|uniref:Uncharacterized protein n=1 Tax=Digitaria exilis TaxID=1010633 RepID=A0A835AKL8_9POAL|nr:hypothetical protein HU200_055804 [Digitaria exilis]CAB3475953.1 unnamed protein product [Digitaria exilis]